MKFGYIARRVIFFGLMAAVLTLSVPSLASATAKARLYTLPLEFDYVAWDMDAFFTKIAQSGVNSWQTLSPETQHRMVTDYIDLTGQLERLQAQIQTVYADPAIKNPAEAAADQLARQQVLQQQVVSLTPMVESILEGQVTEILVESGISRLGVAVPPLLFHTTPLPKALITSPRDSIREDADISLLADLNLDQIDTLEGQVEKATGQSALVVDVGGIGIYPTMVMRSSNLPWIIDTIAHEWTHNFLSIRPLGYDYDTTPELRTMNETTATLVGEEISRLVLSRYYPELLSQYDEGQKLASLAVPNSDFDFRAEMHATRVRVDELLSEGKIEEAEAYMEQRRAVFVEHGYALRKLNQAYFAFYGAYAAVPGGAAGEDPVGPAVRKLRSASPSLAVFLRRIGSMNSYEDLQKAVGD